MQCCNELGGEGEVAEGESDDANATIVLRCDLLGGQEMSGFLNLVSFKPAVHLVTHEPPVLSHPMTRDFFLAHELVYRGFRDFKIGCHLSDGKDALCCIGGHVKFNPRW